VGPTRSRIPGVDTPTPDDGFEAYVPAAPKVEGEDDWPPATREIAIEQAREMRLEEGGLPVDDATLERVADAVMDPDWPVPDVFLTAEELEELDRLEEDEDLSLAVKEYLRRHPEIDGGVREGWRDGRRLLFIALVGDAEAHKAPLTQLGGDRIAFEQAPRPEPELYALQDRIADDAEKLRAEGFDLVSGHSDPARGVVRVQLAAARGAAAAERHFAERYGDAVAVHWLGPSRYREIPHPFGSWTSEGRLLRVFFGFVRGERRGSARLEEENGDRIVIALSCLQPYGLAIGEFQQHHAEVELREPVGDRAVIDASAGVPRPSLAQLRRR
jgi:hypothetical protein